MSTTVGTCLIIDDDAEVASYLQRVAEGIGLSASVITDSRELESELERGEPDVITLDMEMPYRHGLDVLRALVSRRYRGRVIVITATPPDTQDGDFRRNWEMVAAVLLKPVRKKEVERSLLGS